MMMFLFGCATQSNVSIKSFPEGAEVAIVGKEGGVRSIGKTPLVIPPQNLEGGRISSLVISKDGFKEQYVLLGRDRSAESFDITVSLQSQAEDPKTVDTRARQERLAKLLLQAHNLTGAKRYTEAEKVLSDVIQDYPHISAGYDLLGNVAFLQKDLKAALKNYERSLQLNPENSETRSIIEKLKGMLQ